MWFAGPIGRRCRTPTVVVARIAWSIALVVPLVVALSYVHQNGRDVPFWDEWERSAPLAIGAADGSLSLADLIRPHNEHRLLFSGIVTVVSVHLADWSIVGEMYVGILLSFLTCLLVMAIVRQSVSPVTVQVLSLPVAAIVFWPAQWFNWLVGFQTQIFGFMLFSMAAIWVVSRRRRGWASIAIAAVLGNLAHFSQAGGVGIWPSILIGLWMLDYRRSQIAAWLVLSAASLAVFFSGYVIGAPAKVGVGSSVAFALAYLGGFFVGAFDDPHASTAIAVAVAGLAIVGWSLKMVIGPGGLRWSRAAPWAMMILLGLATAALVARNRAHLGLSYALVSRYATQASLVWLGLCGLSGCILDDRRRAEHGLRSLGLMASWGVLAVVIALYLPTYNAALDHGLVSDAQVACLVRLPTTREFGCLAGVHPVFDAGYPDASHRDAILRLVDGLARHRLGVFSSGGSLLAMHDAREAEAIGGDSGNARVD